MCPWIIYYPWTFILVFLFLSIEMSYCSGTDQFPGDIYLLKVNNKHTRGKFFELQQSFSQRFVQIFPIHKNYFFIYFKQHIFLLKP